MNPSFLKKQVSKAPTEPGIYIFTGPDRKKLYIGKASSIKARLLSYLKTTNHRILQMLSRATDIRTIETGSEIEALIMESQYIKKYKPMFNIMLRDDKQFGFVGFTKEEYPKIFITHQPTKVLSIKYKVLRGQKIYNTKYIIPNTDFIGPFTDMGALKTTLRYIRGVSPYCTCKKPHNAFCLNYHIGKCPGFCCLKRSELSIKYKVLREYKKNIKVIKKILSGKKTSLLKHLEKEMIKLGKEAALNDNRSERASLKEREKFNEAIELRNKIEKIKRVFENAKIIKEHLDQRYDTSKNHSESALLELRKFLKLKQPPRRIEGYDVANIQGKHAVGTMAVFTNGQPDKNEYRKFKIYTKNTPDDTAMLKEILTRRFNHPEWKFPDLILIDGGKQQLRTAEAVANSKLHSKQIPIIALTKNKKHIGEKIYIHGRKNSIPLSRLPVSVKNLLLQIDAEAHRFAIGYYRELHRKDNLRN